MTENISNHNIKERKIEIAPSKYQLSSDTLTECGVLTRDVNIGDTEIWVQDNRMTPEKFMKQFQVYVNADTSKKTPFYPIITSLVHSGITQLISEIREYGLTDCQEEIDKLLCREAAIAKKGDNPLELNILREEINKIFAKNLSKKIWNKQT